jgi:HD-GYP domain-containing protein (c-di-GMP phosphodiesterase class II)
MRNIPAQSVRLAELVAAISLATDIGMGQPMEQAMRTCLLGMRVAHALNVDDHECCDVYYLALLRFIGCTSDAHEEAQYADGDEIAHRANLAPLLGGEAPEFLRYMLRDFAAGSPPLTRARLVAGALAEGTGHGKRTIAIHCEIAQMLAGRIGLQSSVAMAVGQIFERWDGRGIPGELKGEEIPIAARIAAVARDADVLYRLGGIELLKETLLRRRGRAHDPAVVDAALDQAPEWASTVESESIWELVLASEPPPQRTVLDVRLDEVLGAFGDFADLKSPWTLGHSSGVARLAEGAASSSGLDHNTTTGLRRAALLHDLGRAGIPNGIWDKPAPLSHTEWKRVRLHPYLSERILAQSGALRPLASLAGSHHERLDGSGYHRGSPATVLGTEARILAAADAYQAMTQPRPYRPALPSETAAGELQREAAAGRLDRDAVAAVLEAAGHEPAEGRHSWPARLTDREIEVLRLIVRGASNREVAQDLRISPKTVGRHVENIYNKIAVSSRPAAALFAAEHGLLRESGTFAR